MTCPVWTCDTCGRHDVPFRYQRWSPRGEQSCVLCTPDDPEDDKLTGPPDEPPCDWGDCVETATETVWHAAARRPMCARHAALHREVTPPEQQTPVGITPAWLLFP